MTDVGVGVKREREREESFLNTISISAACGYSLFVAKHEWWIHDCPMCETKFLSVEDRHVKDQVNLRRKDYSFCLIMFDR